jgi:peptidyl-prolyl cis-trans isomerase-like 4
MALLLETNLGGDLVIDLDIEGSPALCKNILKLAKIRYYTGSLLYNIQANRFCQGGDPTGTGKGGACIFGVLDAQVDDETASQKRFLKSTSGRRLTLGESRERGRIVAMELPLTKDTIGSQFLITLGQGRAGDGMDGYLVAGEEQESATPLSLGMVTEDSENILEKVERSYCDPDGRPYADIRIVRMLVLHDPFPDPSGLTEYIKGKSPGMLTEKGGQIIGSPDRSKPPQESVPERISATELEDEVEETEEQIRKRQEKEALQEDHQRAVVLELLGDLPSAEIKAPDHVLFVCKLNAITQDEDLELIFSRFDPSCNAEIIRDQETGSSLQYAFVEFSNKKQCVEAYFKMNNALVDDRRIKVDFSQSVAKLWNKHTQRLRMPKNPEQDNRGPPPDRRSSSHTNFDAPRNNHNSRGPQNSRENRALPERNDDGGSDDFGRTRRQSHDDNRGRNIPERLDNRHPPPLRHNHNRRTDERRYNQSEGGGFTDDRHRRDRERSRDDNFHRRPDGHDDSRMKHPGQEQRVDHHRRRRDTDRNGDGVDRRGSKSDEKRHAQRSGRHRHDDRQHADNIERERLTDSGNRDRRRRDERRLGEEEHRERRRHHSIDDDRRHGGNEASHHRSIGRHRTGRNEQSMPRDDSPLEGTRSHQTDEKERHRHKHKKRDKDDEERHRKKKERKRDRYDDYDDKRKRRKHDKDRTHRDRSRDGKERSRSAEGGN